MGVIIRTYDTRNTKPFETKLGLMTVVHLKKHEKRDKIYVALADSERSSQFERVGVLFRIRDRLFAEFKLGTVGYDLDTETGEVVTAEYFNYMLKKVVRT